MWRRLWITVATGLTLTGAYQAYSVLIGPAVRIPRRTIEPSIVGLPTETQRPAENVRVAAAWLAQQDWTATAKYLLRTDEMFIYTNEWTPHGENGLIRFRPFAAAWLSRTPEGEEQAVTVCSESALLKFESPFEIDKPQLGRVTGGSLDGEVRITGPDGLEIAGENFLFKEANSSIVSYSPVTFWFGENKGEAGKLQIHLLKSKKPIAKDRPNVVGVDRLQLRDNVRMQLKLDNGEENSQPIMVRCSGLFEYRVEARTAVFDRDVDAFRPDAETPSKGDRLLCDRLSVQFEPKELPADEPRPATEKASAPRRDGEYQHIERNLQFRSLKAEGQRVRVRMHRQALLAEMTQLAYDAPTRTIEMSAPQAVRVKQRLNQLHSPFIRLVMGEDNRSVDALCQGVGWLETHDEETGELVFAADWMKQLKKSTDPETQLDLIELEQDASFRQPSRDTALGADLIRLWFAPQAAAETAEAEPFRIGGQGRDADPRRLLATKNVALVSPQLEADTEELEVLFEEQTPESDPAQLHLGGRKRTSTPPKVEAAYRKRGATGNKPQDNIKLVAAENSAERPSIIVAANKIRVRMHKPDQAETPPEIQEIWTTGDVRVTQPADDGGEALSVTGDRLHVEQESAARQVVHVYGAAGRPAHVRNEQQQLHIEGQVIHLDRGENLAWVEGAGLLQLPVPKTFDGQDLDQPQILDVWWKDRMDFDGLLATFDGNVRAKLAEGKMQCQLMQVALSRKVSFSEESAGQPAAEVQSITCRNNVEFENQRYLDGQLLDIQRAKVFEFHLDHATKLTDAKGPGWMLMWRRGSGKRAGLSVTETVQANRTSQEPATEWEYTRVDFAGRMAGHIGKRSTTFHDRVEVLYGPVLRPTDILDRHHLPKEGGWMQCDQLEVAQAAVPTSEKPLVQLLAAGNTRLEGQGFSGRADQISFDEVKKLYVLKSLGRRTATIWRENKLGEREQQDAQRLEYIPSLNSLKAYSVVGGEGSVGQ